MTNEIFSEAVEVILNARDFCGDESAALRDYQRDTNTIFSSHELFRIRLAADNKWAEFQRECGAKMLLGAERAKAYRDLDA